MEKTNAKYSRLGNIIARWLIFCFLTLGAIGLFFYNGDKYQHFMTYFGGALAGIAYFALCIALAKTFPKLEKWL
jgi:hypothetical protein